MTSLKQVVGEIHYASSILVYGQCVDQVEKTMYEIAEACNVGEFIYSQDVAPIEEKLLGGNCRNAIFDGYPVKDAPTTNLCEYKRVRKITPGILIFTQGEIDNLEPKTHVGPCHFDLIFRVVDGKAYVQRNVYSTFYGEIDWSIND